MNKITLTLLTTVAALVAPYSGQAGSATWNLNPVSNAWNTAANWTPATVPNGASDVATFDVSNTTGISTSGATVSGIVFNASASAFSIAVSTGTLTISGAGITNNSGLTQNFTTSAGGDIFFQSGSTAGNGTTFNNPDSCTTNFTNNASAGTAAIFNSSEAGLTNTGTTNFYDSATAANATITNQASTAEFAQHGGWTFFHDSSTAGSATIINEGTPIGAGGSTAFYDNSTAANATFINKRGVAGDPGTMGFFGTSTAADATFFNEGGNVFNGAGGAMGFVGQGCSAGNAIITCEGGAAEQATGGQVNFGGLADGANSTVILNGGSAPGAFGSTIYLSDGGTAGNSTIVLNGGVNGGKGSLLYVDANGKGGNARLQVYGNSVADLENPAGVIPNTIGSIEGDGQIRLADTKLSVGSNNLSTTFSGLIEDYGYYNETGGSLVKVGNGTLALTRDNTFTGGVTVRRGVLLVNNTSGSGTGPGPVQVQGGALGGKGFIGGTVTVGLGGSQRAALAPGTNGLGVLTIQSALTFGTNASYNWNVDTVSARSDGLVANGVTISAGALFTIFPSHRAAIPVGTVFTVINNYTTTPISGMFSNLPDGGTILVGNNNTFQANYEGGDGNDLTLTVVSN